MVENALSSIIKNNKTHKDWHLAFIDDSLFKTGQAVFEKYMAPFGNQASYWKTDTTAEEKMRAESQIGRFMNEAITASDADIAIMLCDDDELCPDYLQKFK
jgi:hypothetical protein